MTTMHRAVTARAIVSRGVCRGKNPINCFYGDKFPPGGARFLSQAVTARAQPRSSVRRAELHERSRASTEPYLSCYVNFQFNKVYQEVIHRCGDELAIELARVRGECRVKMSRHK